MALRPAPRPQPPRPPAVTNDTVLGDAADNTLAGGAGNDSLDGGAGFDTLDYFALGAGVTLRSQGLIAKGNGGIDSIANIERIIGAAGQGNFIDGAVADPASQTTSFVVDLGANSLVVNGIPFLGTASFVVENFIAVRGTANADDITGNAAANTFLGSAGNDRYDGGAGIDLLDYAGLGGAVTLRAQGVIDKGGFGQDSIVGVEGVLGAAGFANRIDGTVADPSAQTTSFAIDLSLGSLVVNGVPGLGSIAFGVAYFTEVTGTNNADSIRANSVGNRLAGAGGNDTLAGGVGNDRLEGGLGADSITLGAGRDVVVFNNAAEGGDTILDFFGRDDEVQLSASGFGFDAGPLVAAEFTANRAGVANRAQAQFVYDTDGGQLYFDADGSGARQSVLLASFQGAPMLSLADLVLIA